MIPKSTESTGFFVVAGALQLAWGGAGDGSHSGSSARALGHELGATCRLCEVGITCLIPWVTDFPKIG